MIIHGDSLEVLKTLDANSVDAVVTDPPAGISFMGKAWDDDKGGRDNWIKWLESIMRECHRVLKPGGHAFVWAIPRTSHWTGFAVENAGFEIRDVCTHIFGSGFPKSQNVAIQIDKQAGAMGNRGKAFVTAGQDGREDLVGTRGVAISGHDPITDDAKQWQGWGTALKPASEHWILARKPLSESTVAKNVLKWGVGAINVDGARIGTEQIKTQAKKGMYGAGSTEKMREQGFRPYHIDNRECAESFHQGRWPANVLFDEDAAAMLDEQSGPCPSATNKKPTKSGGIWGKGAIAQFENGAPYAHEKATGASRFFKVVKQDQYDILDQCVAKSADARPSNDGESSAQGPAPESSQHASADKSQNKNTLASNAASVLSIGPAIEQSVKMFFAQESARPAIALAKTYLSAFDAGKSVDSTEINTVQSLAKVLAKTDRQSLASLASILDCKSSIPILSHALSAEILESTDTIPTIPSLLRLSGFVSLVIDAITTLARGEESLELGLTRFLYCAKSSKRERNAGLEGMPERSRFENTPGCKLDEGMVREKFTTAAAANHHPTVKPTKLMEYLCKLITPPGGIVLDPFAGSGSTGVAAKRLGFEFIGVERESEYCEIARRRIEHAARDKQLELEGA